MGVRPSEGEGNSAGCVGWANLVWANHGFGSSQSVGFFGTHTDAAADVEDRKLIIGIESETDHLPVGELRKLWASSAL